MKKLKTFAILAILTLAFVSVIPNSLGTSAWIGDRYETDGIAFTSIMDEIGGELGYSFSSYTYERAELYTAAGNLSGYVYDFKLDGIEDGFVLMVKEEYNNQVSYEVTEIFMSQSPFYQNSGVNIYPTFQTYISYDNGVYTDLALNLEIPLGVVLELEEKGFGFNGSVSWTSWTERVDYVTKTIEKDEVSAGGMPTLIDGSSGHVNTCAVIAGNNLINYWAFYKPNLIPGVTVANVLFGKVYWKGERMEISWVPEDLYVRMGTNTLGPGTTIAQFKSGITSFAAAYGNYSVTYRSVMTSGQYDISKMLTEFAADRPVAMFMNPYYNLIGAMATYSGGYDLIAHFDYTGSHTMIACGRNIYKWYDGSGGIVRQMTLLKVASGISGMASGWIRLNEGSLDVNDAFGVEIS